MRYFILFAMTLFTPLVYANDNILNVYSWAQEIPHHIIEQFENETNIQVNYTSYDSNEIMYAKLRTNNKGYDIVEPSSYYIERMQRQGMLEKLDKSLLPNFKNLDPFFLNKSYDPDSQYSIPFIWGTTGIFYNKDAFSEKDARAWSDLFNAKFHNQLMLLDDARHVFATALRMLGYPVNDKNPEHIKQAYIKLKELMPNVRLFNNDAVTSLLIDEDVNIGMALSGDVASAKKENPKLQFVFPTDGFEIWIDNFVILKNAPHRTNAYLFLNFLLRPDIAKEVSLRINYSTANLAARHSMPPEIRNNPILYPPIATLSKGEIQSDNGDEIPMLLEYYWEWLKMGG